MNKTASTVIITVICVITFQFFYIKLSSPNSLLKSASSIRNFPNGLLTSLPSNSNKDFEVIEVKTQLEKISNSWDPIIYVKLKNVSGKDIYEKHKLKVVFLDDLTSEIIDQNFCFVSSNGSVFPKEANKKFNLSTSLVHSINQLSQLNQNKSIIKKNISAKVYLDENLIGTYQVGNSLTSESSKGDNQTLKSKSHKTKNKESDGLYQLMHSEPKQQIESENPQKNESIIIEEEEN